jgi:hypothetical protein
MSARHSATALVPEPETRAEFRTQEAEAEGRDAMVRILALAMLIIAWAVAAMIVAGVIR